jgi:hypothetical protein
MVCCKGDSKRRLISSPVSRFVIQQSFSRRSAMWGSRSNAVVMVPARISGAKAKARIKITRLRYVVTIKNTVVS